MPSQSDRLDGIDLSDATQVHVLWSEIIHSICYVDGLRADVGVVKELACTKEIWKEAVVVKAPYAVGSCWLQQIEDLDSTGKCQVSAISTRKLREGTD